MNRYTAEEIMGDPQRDTMSVARSPVFVHLTSTMNARRADAHQRARIFRDAATRSLFPARFAGDVETRILHRNAYADYHDAACRQESIGNGQVTS